MESKCRQRKQLEPNRGSDYRSKKLLVEKTMEKQTKVNADILRKWRKLGSNTLYCTSSLKPEDILLCFFYWQNGMIVPLCESAVTPLKMHLRLCLITIVPTVSYTHEETATIHTCNVSHINNQFTMAVAHYADCSWNKGESTNRRLTATISY